jgi:hypothetical protein
MSLFALAERAAQAPAFLGRPADPAVRVTEGAARAAPAGPAADTAAAQPPAAVGTALKRLVDFIPTETITLFWLAVPASRSLATLLPADAQSPPTWIDWTMFGVLVCLTPMLLVLVYLSNLASQNKPRPEIKSWPWWKALAATIAFTCWAPAVPGNPFLTNPAVLMAVWVGATVVSMVLGLLDPIITQPRQPT